MVLVVVRTIISSHYRVGDAAPRPRHPRASHASAHTKAENARRPGDTATVESSIAPVISSSASAAAPPPPPTPPYQPPPQQPPPPLPPPKRSSSVYVPDEVVAIVDMGLHEVEPFIATYDWQEIKEGQSIPAGLYVKVDLQTGKKMAKLLRDRPGIMLPSEIRAAAAAAGGAHTAPDPMNHRRKSGAEQRRARLEREHRERAL